MLKHYLVYYIVKLLQLCGINIQFTLYPKLKFWKIYGDKMVEMKGINKWLR